MYTDRHKVGMVVGGKHQDASSRRLDDVRSVDAGAAVLGYYSGGAGSFCNF